MASLLALLASFLSRKMALSIDSRSANNSSVLMV